jgi:hypothetical protein
MKRQSLHQYFCFILLYYFFISFCCESDALTQTGPNPDQQFIIETGDSLLFNAESVKDIVKTDDGAGIKLSDSVVSGNIILKPQSAPYPYDIGLPSWNGSAPGDSGSFRVLIRVPYLSDWSPWLEVGYWKANLWQGRKSTTFNGGKIDIDTVVLYYYATEWQFAIEMKRNSSSVPSPTLSLLSFFISDSRKTQNIDYTAIINDKPESIFIPTTFLAQYRISNEIGGSICSPTTVSMILLSYSIQVDPLQFAIDTLDPYYDIFGVWPRVVQNASEYGLKGTVTRYRTWSETREVLANGGRIGMSIGPPLYSGHLVMLAGFTENGDPIVHDPARTYDGYAHVFNKNDLSHSWFDKGGVAYTFYLRDSSKVTPVYLAKQEYKNTNERSLVLLSNYPNPFNASTTFSYELKKDGFVDLSIYNILGELIKTVESEYEYAGQYRIQWDGRNSWDFPVTSGTYIYQIRFEQNEVMTGKLMLVR